MNRPRLASAALFTAIILLAPAVSLQFYELFRTTAASDATFRNKLTNSLRQHATAVRFKNRISDADLQRTTLIGILKAVQNGTKSNFHIDWSALQNAGLSPASKLKINDRTLTYHQYLTAACKQLNVSLVLYCKEPEGQFTLTTFNACPPDIRGTERPRLPEADTTGAWDFADHPGDNTLRQKLAETFVDFTVNDQPFEQVIQVLQQTAKLSFNINWSALQSAGVDRGTLLSINLQHVPLRKALHVLLTEAGGTAGLDYIVNAGLIEISTSEDLTSNRYQVVRLYDVRSLLAYGRASYGEDLRHLINTIQSVIAPHSWQGARGTSGTLREYNGSLREYNGSLREYNGSLIIRQTRENHLAIAELFKTLNTYMEPTGPGETLDGWDLIDSPHDRAVMVRMDQLADPLIVTDQPFESVLQTLRERTQLNISINWAVLQSIGINRDTPITLALSNTTLRKTFDAILAQADDQNDIAYIIDQGTVTISSRRDLQSAKYQEVHVYDIRLLLGNGPGYYGDRVRNLVDTIQATIAPETWANKGGTFSTIRVVRDRLIIRQVRENHLALVQLLKHCALLSEE